MTLFHSQFTEGLNQRSDILLVQKAEVFKIQTGVDVIPYIAIQDLTVTVVVLILILQAGVLELSRIIDHPTRLGLWVVLTLLSLHHVRFAKDGRYRRKL